MSYVYRHIRLDKNEVFYVGVGNANNYARAYSSHGRNCHWYNIVKKTPYEVEIIIDGLTAEEARIKEVEFIALYGRRKNGGTLSNLTDGGDGKPGWVMPNETKTKISLGNKGKQRSGEIRAAMSERQKGKIVSADVRKKMTESHKERMKSPYLRSIVSKIFKGKNLSEDHIKKLSKAKYALSENDVLEIKRLRSLGLTIETIHFKTGVSERTIGRILNGISYKYIAA